MSLLPPKYNLAGGFELVAAYGSTFICPILSPRGIYD